MPKENRFDVQKAGDGFKLNRGAGRLESSVSKEDVVNLIAHLLLVSGVTFEEVEQELQDEPPGESKPNPDF